MNLAVRRRSGPPSGGWWVALGASVGCVTAAIVGLLYDDFAGSSLLVSAGLAVGGVLAARWR